MLQRWWANLTGQNMRIKAGGQVFSGDKISISGDIVGRDFIVNGVKQSVTINNDRIQLEIIGGTVDKVETSMTVHCGDVGGNVDAGMSVHCGNVGGDVDAGMTVHARDITGDADAGMSIKCQSIGGKAKSKL